MLSSKRRDIHIVTPWLTWRALSEAGLLPPIGSAIAAGATLTIYVDAGLNAARANVDETAAADFSRAVQALRQAGAEVLQIRDVHSKIVMADDDLYCVGSFNWLSAARGGHYARHETSLAYIGRGVAADIEVMQDSLRKRLLHRSDR